MNSTFTPASVIVRRKIAAAAEDLFDAWLDPQALGIWMLPNSIRSTQAKVDARVGGQYEIQMSSDTDVYPHHGTYLIIDRPRRLMFTWISRGTEQQETLVTVDFLHADQHTEVVITHDKLQDAARDSHTNGWTSALENFDRYMTSKTS